VYVSNHESLFWATIAIISDGYFVEVHRLSADTNIGRLSASSVSAMWQSASADNRPIICFSKQNNKKCF